MKTIVDVADQLLRAMRRITAREPSFRLRKATFRGRGLQPELTEADWDRIRDLAFDRPDDSDINLLTR